MLEKSVGVGRRAAAMARWPDDTALGSHHSARHTIAQAVLLVLGEWVNPDTSPRPLLSMSGKTLIKMPSIHLHLYHSVEKTLTCRSGRE